MTPPKTQNPKKTIIKKIITTILIIGSIIPATVTSAEPKLIEVSSTKTTMPNPGHRSHWTTAITKTTPNTIDLEIAFKNPTNNNQNNLITIYLEDDNGNTIIQQTPISQLNKTTTPIGSLDKPTLNLKGTIHLDYKADNSYQGISETLDFQIIATPRPTPPGRTQKLADTGITILTIIALITLGIGAILTGLAIYKIRNERKQHAQK